MTPEKMLLIEARKELQKHYVPLVQDERESDRNYSQTGEGCCAMGALVRARRTIGGNFHLFVACEEKLNQIAKNLHPDQEGEFRYRDSAIPKGIDGDEFGAKDHFSLSPIVFVNNHLGKDAILEVFDKTIEAME